MQEADMYRMACLVLIVLVSALQVQAQLSIRAASATPVEGWQRMPVECADRVMWVSLIALQMNPKLFEDTVASVFQEHGYQARVTGQSGDGGIDVVLDGADK
jgi:restriction endonuclease Mrr